MRSGQRTTFGRSGRWSAVGHARGGDRSSCSAWLQVTVFATTLRTISATRASGRMPSAPVSACNGRRPTMLAHAANRACLFNCRCSSGMACLPCAAHEPGAPRHRGCRVARLRSRRSPAVPTTGLQAGKRLGPAGHSGAVSVGLVADGACAPARFRRGGIAPVVLRDSVRRAPVRTRSEQQQSWPVAVSGGETAHASLRSADIMHADARIHDAA